MGIVDPVNGMAVHCIDSAQLGAVGLDGPEQLGVLAQQLGLFGDGDQTLRMGGK